jgi:hypothetical protein
MQTLVPMNDYCQHRLLVVGPASDLKAFDRNADWTEIPGATDLVLQKHSPSRRVRRDFNAGASVTNCRVISRRWPTLVFLLHYECEDCRLLGLVRAKNGKLRHHRFKY